MMGDDFIPTLARLAGGFKEVIAALEKANELLRAAIPGSEVETGYNLRRELHE